mgnify:CR=1 FL=1
MIHGALRALISGRDLDEDEATEAIEEVLSGEASAAQIAALATALRMKGETVTEIRAAARALRRRCEPIEGLPGTPPTRQLYAGGDLAAPAAINTVAIPVSVSGGLGAVAMGGLTRPWSEYVARVRNLRTLIDTLAQDHRQLADALSHAGGSH